MPIELVVAGVTALLIGATWLIYLLAEKLQVRS